MEDQRMRVQTSEAGAISIAERIVASGGFKLLFREGMALVEDTAAYLDGAGREESRALGRSGSLAYASESMRLTTRLMQMTSWLLLQRAVNEGELSRREADEEHRKVRMSPQDMLSAPEMASLLPQTLRDLIARSLKLQARISHLDQQLKDEPPTAAAQNPVQSQMDGLRARLCLA